MVFQNFRFCVDLPPYLKTKSWTNLFYYGFPFDSPVRHLEVWILSLPSPKSPLPRRRSPFIFIASITLALHCLSFLHICSTSRSHVVTKCEHFFWAFFFNDHKKTNNFEIFGFKWGAFYVAFCPTQTAKSFLFSSQNNRTLAKTLGFLYNMTCMALE